MCIEILPVVQYVGIRFHLWHGLCPFETIALVLLHQVIEDQGIGTT